MYKTEKTCRSCGSSDLHSILDFGETPLADRLLNKDQLGNDSYSAPLTTAFCGSCSLVQILETVDPEILFYAEYPYFSSVSKSLLAHFRASALNIIESRDLNENSLVVEAASNDGYMLRNFKEKNISVLGIEPTDGPAKAANDLGIETRKLFFTSALAADLRKEFPQGADVFLANNVLAHVPDLNGFVSGIGTVLNENGVAVIEAPYLVDLVDHCEFDTIYHQHMCYFSVTALDRLFRRHNLYLNHIDRTTIHGGSLRLFIEPKEAVQNSVRELLEMERKRKVDKLDYYHDFAARVAAIKKKLMNMLMKLKSEGKSIAGYGAAAKGMTMMSYMGINSEILDFVADKNTFKHNKYYCGIHIPIRAAEAVLQEMPDYIVILAWNFAQEIMAEQSEYADKGGRFIVPIPDPTVI